MESPFCLGKEWHEPWNCCYMDQKRMITTFTEGRTRQEECRLVLVYCRARPGSFKHYGSSNRSNGKLHMCKGLPWHAIKHEESTLYKVYSSTMLNMAIHCPTAWYISLVVHFCMFVMYVIVYTVVVDVWLIQGLGTGGVRGAGAPLKLVRWCLPTKKRILTLLLSIYHVHSIFLA